MREPGGNTWELSPSRAWSVRSQEEGGARTDLEINGRVSV